MSRLRQPPLRPVVQILKTEAKRRGWTAYRLAIETGLQAQTIRRLLGGQGSPSLDTLEAVAKALGLKLGASPE